MTRLSIVQATLDAQGMLHDPTLGVSVVEATSVNSETRRVIEDLRDTMWSYEICVGLAAPQIGSQLRVAVINVRRAAREQDLVLVNPRIVRIWGKKDTKRESCMSLWGLQGNVERRRSVEVEYLGPAGKISQVFEGMEARVVQHEVDHLDGVMYVGRMADGEAVSTTEIFSGLSPFAS